MGEVISARLLGEVVLVKTPSTPVVRISHYYRVTNPEGLGTDERLNDTLNQLRDRCGMLVVPADPAQ